MKEEKAREECSQWRYTCYYRGRGRGAEFHKLFAALETPRQYHLVLLVKAGW
jgi:hypothetical protein